MHGKLIAAAVFVPIGAGDVAKRFGNFSVTPGTYLLDERGRSLHCRPPTTENALRRASYAGNALIFLDSETWHAHCGLLGTSPCMGSLRFF